MNIRTFFAVTLLALTAAVHSFAQAAASEQSLARVPLENYLRGHATGEPEYIKKAFAPTAVIEGYGATGKFIRWTLEDYVKGFSGKASDEEPKRKRWIDKVDITGNAAIATLRFDYPAAKITDYMLLLKIDGEWKIVNKIFHGEMKGQK